MTITLPELAKCHSGDVFGARQTGDTLAKDQPVLELETARRRLKCLSLPDNQRCEVKAGDKVPRQAIYRREGSRRHRRNPRPTIRNRATNEQKPAEQRSEPGPTIRKRRQRSETGANDQNVTARRRRATIVRQCRWRREAGAERTLPQSLEGDERRKAERRRSPIGVDFSRGRVAAEPSAPSCGRAGPRRRTRWPRLGTTIDGRGSGQSGPHLVED